MQNLKRIKVKGAGPEDVVFDAEGRIYTGLKDGNAVVRVDPVAETAEVIARPGGRPLGIEILPDGRLLLCNAPLGLQVIDTQTGDVTPFPIKGERIHLCNNAHVLSDGTILVSDSSSAFALDEYPKDIIQNSRTGRLIKLAPDGQASVLLDGLPFANGVVCLEEENVALVAATGDRVIRQVELTTGAVSHFAQVDGHPDNLSIGSDGRVWVAVPSTTNAALAHVHKLPLPIRKVISALPEALRPKPVLSCTVHVYNRDGSLHRVHTGDTDVFNMVTGVRERDGLVAMGSIEHDAIALFEAG